MSELKPRTGTIANPVALTTSLRIHFCFFCDVELVEKNALHWCPKCSFWFRVMRGTEIPAVKVMT